MSANDGTYRASDVAIPDIEWYYFGRFPKCENSVLSGMPGKGKSTATADIVADHTRKGETALHVNMDDGIGMTRARLEAAGADLDKVIIREQLSLPRDLPVLELLIIKHGITLIVLDPVNKVVSVNLTNDERTNSELLNPLNALMREHGVSVLMVDHANKSVSHRSDPLNALRGTSLGRSARCVAFFGVNPAEESERCMAWVKQSYAEKPHAILYEMEQYEVEDETTGVSVTVAKLIVTNSEVEGVDPISLLTGKGSEGGSTGPKAERLALAAEWLTEKLLDAAVFVKDIRNDAAQAGLAWGTLRRAQEEICAEAVPCGGGNRSWRSRTYWQLPEKHPERVGNPAYVDANDLYMAARVDIATARLDTCNANGDKKGAAEAQEWLDAIAAEKTPAPTGVQVEAPSTDTDDSADEDGDSATLTDDDIRKLLGGE